MLSNDQHCEGFQRDSTIIYTRNQPDQDGNPTCGTLEFLPVQHCCIHVAPVSYTIVSQESLKLPSDDKSWDKQGWDDSLWRHHLHNRAQVFESHWRPEVLDEVDNLDMMRSGRHMALTTPGLDILPYASGFYAKHFGPNAIASSARIDGDPLLECQNLRHVMFKGPKIPPDNSMLFEFLLGEHALNMDEDFTETIHAVHTMIRHQIEDMFRLRWDLLTNLESLFLDFSTLDFVHHTKPRVITNMFREMGKHLQLKLLVVKGLPVKLRFTEDYFEHFDSWFDRDLDHVDQSDTLESLLENRTMDDWIRTFENKKSVFGEPSYIHFIKDCLRPRGKLHIIYDAQPGTWEWPGPHDVDGWLHEDEGLRPRNTFAWLLLVMWMAVLCHLTLDVYPYLMNKGKEPLKQK
ncbi:hypothetical protein B0T10DRAFT_472950 [Thelonectria olida]|uniref:Uncharacterized protein n=1 Tax=Thelonectria olida TaxID=1576542 RepID=A0A9P9ASQ4_9HYPO|nr:hypothetical protein B0T10DRAFT_472950 [Thelonectria olida]